MDSLSSVILNKKVIDGNIAVFYLGQAGIIIKDSNGSLIAVDLYLSDCVERFDGFKRLMPKLIEANELVFDVIIATHAHYDHFDIDSIPVLMNNNKTVLLAAYDCMVECKILGIDSKRTVYLKDGDKYNWNNVSITAVFCDHGPMTPDAIGLIITIADKKIYIAGDTALHTDRVLEIANLNVDVMLAPINGAYGNLNEYEAVELCKAVNPKLMIPCHYWCFAEHGGNPYVFMKEMQAVIPKQKYLVMRMGECLDI